MSKEPTIAVVGATGVGLIYRLPRMPRTGETILAEEVRPVPGGKASNHAIGLARLGAKAFLISTVGDDGFAEQLRRDWAAAGVDHGNVVTLPHTTMIGSVLVDDEGRNAIAIGPGVLDHFRAEHVDKAYRAIAASDLCLVSLEMPAEPGLRALQIARECGVRSVLNPAPAPPPETAAELVRLADVVVPNEGEAEAMTRAADPREAGERLLAMGAGIAVVTLGAKGALVVSPGSAQRIPAPRVDDPFDTSGAGDAFLSAFCATLARGVDVVEACRRGCLAGSLTVQGPGFVDTLSLWDAHPVLKAGQ